MVDIPSAAAEIRRGKKERKKELKPQGKNIMACPILWRPYKPVCMSEINGVDACMAGEESEVHKIKRCAVYCHVGY